MSPRRALTLLVVSTVFAGGCGSGSSASATVKTTGAEIASVAGHRTYSYALAEQAPGQYERGALQPALLEKVKRDVDAQLHARGYVPAEEGELVVRISTGRRAIEVQPTGSTALAGAPAKEETEGALVIDLIERDSGRLLFHGFARDVLHGGEVKDEQISKAVTRILAPVPAATPAP